MRSKTGASRKRIAAAILDEVLCLSRRRCCICVGLNRDLSLKQGQVAHLDRNPANNDLDNLAFFCLDHHDQYDSRTSQSKGLTPGEVRRFRKELHEIIDRDWKEPVSVPGAHIRAPGDHLGRYVRETEHESAEFEVTYLSDGRVRFSGMAFWGTKREYGPHIGELEFEAHLADNRIEFTDKTRSGEEYRLEITFANGRAVAKERYVVGYFGMNVSFEGEYERV
jgi:hypothetical protein